MAWIMANDTNGTFATAAPVCLQRDGMSLKSLVGHLPRSSRLALVLNRPIDALILLAGPNTYISPSWFSDRTQAPTWNYASVQFSVRMRLVDDSGFLDAHLRELVSIVEKDRPHAWGVDEMGARYSKLSERIVSFNAAISSWSGRFKLGQDEPDKTFDEIMASLPNEMDGSILRWMKAFNSDR